MRRKSRIKRISPDSARKASKRAQSELIYGFHPVLAALGNPARRKQRLMLTKEARKSLSNEAAANAALAGRRSNGMETALAASHLAARAEIDSALPPGAVHQGFLLQCEPLAAVALEDCCARPASDSPVVVLDQVSDPHNVGAILRSAAAFGARAVILQDRHSPAATGVLAKAASGAVEIVPLVRVTNLARAMDQLKGLGYWLTGLDAGAEMMLGGAALKPPVALVLGAEGSGLRRLTREKCDTLAAIRLAGPMHSLNVSNAAAVALYQLTLNN
jgi:23S rRNA (guanosine2251-2'-O)-methyltransferase